MSSKAIKLVKGSALRIIQFAFTVIISLIMMPFVIHSLGDKMYGMWILVGSFLGYYGLLNFGLSSAVQRYISKAIGEKNYDEINKIVNTSLLLFIILGLIALVISIITAVIVPILIKNITDVNMFRKIMLIVGVSFVIGFPMRVFLAIFEANLRYDICAAIELMKLFTRTALIILFLKMGYGIIALALITFSVSMFEYLSQYYLVKKLYSNIVYSRKYIEISKMKMLFEYSKYSFIAQLADILRFKVDNLVIVIFMGLSQITLYSIAARIIKYFMELIMASVGMLTPVFSQYDGMGDYGSIRDKFIFMTKISSYISIFIGGTLIIFGKAFIERWMGIDYLDGYPLLIVLVVPIMIALMQSPSIQLLYGISKHKFFAISNSIEGIANLIISLLLVRKYGLIGVALGTAIPMIFIKLFVQPIYTCKAIKLDLWKYYFGVMIPVILKSSFVIISFWYLFRVYIHPSYLSLLALIVCEVLCFTVIIYFIGFQINERNSFKSLIKKNN